MRGSRIRRGSRPPDKRVVGELSESSMKTWMLAWLRDEQGQDLVEYALIVAAVGLALISTVNTLSQAITSLYSSITTDLGSIGTTAQ